MTFREKLAKEHPECISEKALGGCVDCPYKYGYESMTEEDDCPENGDCTKCWDREISTTPIEKETQAFEAMAKATKEYASAYDQGLKDAWELVRRMFQLNDKEGKEIFGDETLQGAILNHNPKEALEKMKAYEEAQEIKVGDMVFNDDTMEEGVVTYIEDDLVFMLYSDGSCGDTNGNLTKTGKHIDIESLLGQIRGE